MWQGRKGQFSCLFWFKNKRICEFWFRVTTPLTSGDLELASFKDMFGMTLLHSEAALL
jgi:hypothetical protein